MDASIKEIVAKYDPQFNPEIRLDNSNNKLNCFVNSVVQVFWHVRALRESLEMLNGVRGNETGIEWQIVECLLVSHLFWLTPSQDLFEQAVQKNTNEITVAEHEQQRPLLSPDRLRLRIFEYKYNAGNQFDLFKKADCSELMQCLLELIHFCLNPTKSKKSIDDSCGNRCLVHKNVYLNSYVVKSCECSSLKESKQAQHVNNFMHFVYAHEVLTHCEEVLKSHRKDISYLQNCLVDML